MKSDEVIEIIIKTEGECYNMYHSICGKCPFYDKCMQIMIVEGKWVDPNERLQFAIDAAVEKALFDEQD